jgi:hypothetical protein
MWRIILAACLWAGIAIAQVGQVADVVQHVGVTSPTIAVSTPAGGITSGTLGLSGTYGGTFTGSNIDYYWSTASGSPTGGSWVTGIAASPSGGSWTTGGSAASYPSSAATYYLFVRESSATSVVSLASGAVVVGAAYVGPGDLPNGTAAVWGGLRAYSAAAGASGVAAINLCLPSDTQCEDEHVNSSGNLTLGTYGSTCNTTSVICTIKTVYRQDATGGSCTQATISNRPTFNPSYFGAGRPAWVWPGSTTQGFSCTIASLSPPFTFGTVASNTESSWYFSFLMSAYPGKLGFWPGNGNTLGYYDSSSNQTATCNLGGLALNSPYVVAYGTNGTLVANAAYCVDVTSVSALGTTLLIGTDGITTDPPFTGVQTEFAIWPNVTVNPIANMRAYWGI